MMRKEHVFDHSSQLNALTVVPILRTRSMGTIRLGGAMERHEKRATWERDLNRNYYACGCDTGAKGLIIGLFAGVIVQAFSAAPWFSWTAAGIVFGIALLGALAGKAAGLASAEGRLKRTIREITAEVRSREPQFDDPIPCG